MITILDLIRTALKKNVIKYISLDEFADYKQNDSFISNSTYAYRQENMLKDEVGIDGQSLERLVLKQK